MPACFTPSDFVVSKVLSFCTGFSRPRNVGFISLNDDLMMIVAFSISHAFRMPLIESLAFISK